MTPEDLNQKIAQGKTEPLYFLYGPETFYHVEAIRALTKKWINEDNRDFNLETFDARTSIEGESGSMHLDGWVHLVCPALDLSTATNLNG